MKFSWSKSLIWLVFIVALVWFILHITSTLIIFALGWLMAYLLMPIIRKLELVKLGKWGHIRRLTALIIVYSCLFGTILALGSILAPELVEQVVYVQQQIETISADSLASSEGLEQGESTAGIKERVDAQIASALEWFPKEYQPFIESRVNNFITFAGDNIGSWSKVFLSWLYQFMSGVFSGMMFLVGGLLLSFYFLMNWEEYTDWAYAWLPKSYTQEARYLVSRLDKIFGSYIKATTMTSIICTIITYLSLHLTCLIFGIDFPYKLVISLAAGICYPVPVLGIIVATILAGILAFLPNSSLGDAFIILSVVNIANNIIDRFFYPKMMGDAMGVSEVFILFSAMAGGELMGIVGMLLGIPFAAMLRAILNWVYHRFILDTPLPDYPEPETKSLESDPELEVEPEVETQLEDEEDPPVKG